MRLNFAILFAVLFASLIAPAVPTQVSTVPELHKSAVDVDVQKGLPKKTDLSPEAVRIDLNANDGRKMSDYKASPVSDKVMIKEEDLISMADYTKSGVSDKVRLNVEKDNSMADYTKSGVSDKVRLNVEKDNSMADYRINDPMFPGLQFPDEPSVTMPDLESKVPDIPIYPEALCEYPIEITGDGAFVHPDSSIIITANQPVEWSLQGMGLLEKFSPTKVRYIPPRYFNGKPGLDVKVVAYKGFCRDEATIKVRAGPVEKMYMDYPNRVAPNQNRMVSLKVFDKYDNPVQGATISLTLTPLDSADDTSLSADGIIGKKVTPKADETGAVSAYIVAGSERGRYEITARYGLKTVTGVFEVRSASGGGHSHDDDDDDTTTSTTVTNSTESSTSTQTSNQTTSGNVTANQTNSTQTQPTASPQDSAASSISISYPKKAYVGDVITVRVTSGNTAVAGREVTITSPDGKSVKKKTSQLGYVEQVAEMVGRYAFHVDGAEKPVYVDVSAKPVQPAKPASSEPSFDIVGALTGGNAGMLPVVALLVLLGIVVIGVAVYFLRKTEPE